MTQILSSAPLKKKITKELKSDCRLLMEKGVQPFLKVILVGKNPASLIYTSNKKRYCERIGAKCEIMALDEKITEAEFLQIIKEINKDPAVHGCIIQLPLPEHLAHLSVGKLIAPEKDVDGFHPDNFYGLISNQRSDGYFVSCTPKGILTLLKEYEISVEGKSVAILGRSMIVGKPLACLLTNNNATVTLCHKKTQNLKEITKNCDILITAMGVPKFIDETYISDTRKQVVIDVGMNTDQNGNLCGDVNFEKIKDLVAAITPVPGGVGPMTIISLAQNLLQASKNRVII